jgi:hypothetical protein
VSSIGIVNALIREFLRLLEEAQQGKANKYMLLKALDELEDNVDRLIIQMVPERITDERFEATLEILKKIASGFYKIRSLIVNERYSEAVEKVARLQEVLRHCFRALSLIKAGAPTPMVLQMVPSTPLVPSEALLESNPAALRLYNMLARRGETDLTEATRELGLTAETLNEAVNTLVRLGFARVVITPDGKWVLRAVR